MLNTGEILSTVSMIREQKLDIRTITMGISLYDLICDDPNRMAERVYDRICQRAGKLQSGGDMALAAIRSGKARVAVVDAQASANTVKKITDACIYYHVPLLTLPDGLLGAACGREGRMIAAVCDAGFASRLQMLMTEAE